MQIAQSILRFLQQPVLVLDEALCPVTANPAFQQAFGLDGEVLEGTALREFIQGPSCQPRLCSPSRPVRMSWKASKSCACCRPADDSTCS